MSGDDWSSVELKEDEWTEVEADDESSQWSFLSGEKKPTIQNSVVSFVNIPIKISAFSRRKTEVEEQDGSSDIKDCWRRKRYAKRASKYSLVRTIECGPYGMATLSDGNIESMPRGLDSSLSAKIPVDDLVSELFVKPTATGLAQRWSGELHYSEESDDGYEGFCRKCGVKHGNSSRRSSRKPGHPKTCKRSHCLIKFDIDDALICFQYDDL